MATKSTTGGEAREAAARATDRTKEAVHNIADQARELGDAAAQGLKDAGADAARSFSDKASEKTHSIASSLNMIADKLGEGGGQVESEWVAGLTNQTQAALKSAAHYLESAKPQNFVKDMTGFARERPGIVIGGALLLGFVLARAGKVAAAEFADAGTPGPVTGGAQPGDRDYAHSLYPHDDGAGRNLNRDVKENADAGV